MPGPETGKSGLWVGFGAGRQDVRFVRGAGPRVSRVTRRKGQAGEGERGRNLEESVAGPETQIRLGRDGAPRIQNQLEIRHSINADQRFDAWKIGGF